MAGSKAYMPGRLNFSRKGDCGMCGRGTVPNEVAEAVTNPYVLSMSCTKLIDIEILFPKPRLMFELGGVKQKKKKRLICMNKAPLHFTL